jgi:hypothetical protein
MSAIEQGLEWWATLNREDKARWLQCDATPDEIDADLNSPDPEIREAAAIASVGDAWIAFKAAARTAAASAKPLRYIVILNGNGLPPYLYDTETKTKVRPYATVAEAEPQAIMLNKFIRPGLVP